MDCNVPAKVFHQRYKRKKSKTVFNKLNEPNNNNNNNPKNKNCRISSRNTIYGSGFIIRTSIVIIIKRCQNKATMGAFASFLCVLVVSFDLWCVCACLVAIAANQAADKAHK